MVTKIVSKAGLSLFTADFGAFGLIFVTDIKEPVVPDWDDWRDLHKEIRTAVAKNLSECSTVIFCGNCRHSKEAYQDLGVDVTFSYWQDRTFITPEQVMDRLESIFGTEVLPLF